ncbi:MAG TPA: hypothetical protein VEU29_03460 [Actinomycetota bacterium]|nr:hypothetical protein [Actinomycetota bacterium]
MLRRQKSFAVVAVAAAALALLPAGASARRSDALMAACQAKPLGTHSELGQLVAVFGAYKGPADAAEEQLRSGIVRYGVTVDRVQDPLAGPVAALAAVRTVGGGSVSPCYQVKVVHLSGGVTYHGNCP